MAISGGRTPWLMLRALADEQLPWENVHVVQVDERAAPAGDPDRNLLHLRKSLLDHAPLFPSHIHAMPVEPAEAIHEQGAQVAATPAEAARHAEIAITMLADDRAVESVVLGESGLAEGLPKDAVHVSMSTISVALSERLVAHAERGQQFVAAPVFGRPDQAEGGKLFIAAAGSGDAVKRICPALDAMGQRTFVIGETPAQANLLKLTGNFLITCVIESLAEAFALTTKGGIETSKVYELLTETLFAAPVYKTYGGMILEGKFSPPGFKIALGQKDNRLIQLAAEKLEVPLPFAGIVRDRFLAALAHGDGDLDWSAIAKRAADDAGVGHG